MPTYVLINFLLIAAWFIPIFLALWVLRSRDLSETARALWALVILAVPMLGPIAFLLSTGAPKIKKE